MANITELPQYLNLTKLSEYNQTLNIEVETSFNSILAGILNIFALYPILQWFTSFMVFVALYLLLRNLQNNNFTNLSNIQIASLTSFIIIAMNSLLLLFNIFTILQPLQFFILVWLFCTLISIINK